MSRFTYRAFNSTFSIATYQRIVLTLLITLGTQVISAQSADTIRAGGSGVPKIALHVGEVGDEGFLVNNGKTIDGPKSTKETREVKCGSDDCYLVVMTTFSPRGNMVDSVWANRKTFALVKHVERAPGIHTEVNVANGRIRGIAADSGKADRTIDEAAPAFDFSVIEEIVANLPLAAKYHTIIHAFDVTQGFRDVAITVVGAEVLETPLGRRSTWAVEMSFGTHKATRWFDRETRQGIKWQVDMGGGRVMWGQQPKR